MTAELAVMNRSAVALAADSAMTFGEEGQEKIYATNKIFTLSKFHPIAIMIYNNADHMQVPLETIIKLYRQREWNQQKTTVDAYARSFLEFLLEEHFCTESQVKANVFRVAHSLFEEIYRDVEDELLRKMFSTGKMPKKKLGTMLKQAIRAQHTTINALQDTSSFRTTEARAIIQKYNDTIDSVINYTFANRPSEVQIPVSGENKNALLRLLILCLTKEWMSESYSGIVFAGFGDDEIFPSLVEVRVDGAIDGTLKLMERSPVDISRDRNNSCVRAFAQSEMVQRFMDGVDYELERYMYHLFHEEMIKFGNKLVDDHSAASDREKKQIKKDITKSVGDHMQSLVDAVQETKRDVLSLPIVKAVANMPKAELAHMAEALVNLTSVKRRVSTEKETVGGPVDVAVISKQDGFVWIRRKHYFDYNLNRDFINKYFQHGDV